MPKEFGGEMPSEGEEKKEITEGQEQKEKNIKLEKNKIVDILYGAIPAAELAVKSVENEGSYPRVNAEKILKELDRIMDKMHNDVNVEGDEIEKIKQMAADLDVWVSSSRKELNSGMIHPSNTRAELERSVFVVGAVTELIDLTFENKGNLVVDYLNKYIIRGLANEIDRRPVEEKNIDVE